MRRSSTTPTPARRPRLEILEFANSQLLEFRYYDELLDGELARIYAELQKPRPVGPLRADATPGRRTRSTRSSSTSTS